MRPPKAQGSNVNDSCRLKPDFFMLSQGDAKKGSSDYKENNLVLINSPAVVVDDKIDDEISEADTYDQIYDILMDEYGLPENKKEVPSINGGLPITMTVVKGSSTREGSVGGNSSVNKGAASNAVNYRSESRGMPNVAAMLNKTSNTSVGYDFNRPGGGPINNLGNTGTLALKRRDTSGNRRPFSPPLKQKTESSAVSEAPMNKRLASGKASEKPVLIYQVDQHS